VAPVTPSRGAPTITVLFVDDEPALLRVIARSLQGLSFRVVTADGAAEALAVMRAGAVDVLVSDIDMPGMTGLELVKIVRREFPSTVRMLLTGAATMARTLEAINEGEVHRFFTKPFDAALFHTTMTGLVERIERLRRDGELEARRAALAEFHAWVDEVYPGTLQIVRNAQGEIVIEPPLNELRLLDELSSPAPDRPSG